MAKRSRSRRFRSYPRRQYRRFRRGKAPMPILPLIGLGATVAPIAKMALEGRTEDAMNVAIGNFTGYNVWTKKWDPVSSGMINAYLPMLAGIAGHMVANKLGVNRAIRKVPVIGKWVAL